MTGRYFADHFDADGLWYVFDSEDGGAQACGPFPSGDTAQAEANNLNADNDFPSGVRPHMIQARLGLPAIEREVSIHDLFTRVREHPEYVFGVIFVLNDFPNREANWDEAYDSKHAEEHTTAAGFEYIEFGIPGSRGEPPENDGRDISNPVLGI